ncbi:hypothetical protein GQX74_003067 [Glossina fuscipes]|nr:hypothetical protein GQX74_003067 [Glossina fuscipes]
MTVVQCPVDILTLKSIPYLISDHFTSSKCAKIHFIRPYGALVTTPFHLHYRKCQAKLKRNQKKKKTNRIYLRYCDFSKKYEPGKVNNIVE